MSIEEKFLELVRRCKYGVKIEINAHRGKEGGVKRVVVEIDCDLVHIMPATQSKMIEQDSVIFIEGCPDAPGAVKCRVAHWDLESALDEALNDDLRNFE